MSKSEDKIVKQSDRVSREKTEKKELLLGNRKDPCPSTPAGGPQSMSYSSPDLVKQSDPTECFIMSKGSGSKQSDTDLAGYISLISEYYKNPVLLQSIILS
jgi:hypothetical protein